VQEKGIAGFGLDGCEVVAVFDMATEQGGVDDWVESFGVGV
jgi:hypothetical protein